ncbi:hypothetical protein ACET3Z_009914 [Daucus carota]
MSGEAIYFALTRLNCGKVRKLCMEHPEGPFLELTQRRDSVLQKALYSKQVDLVLDLLQDARVRWLQDFHKKLGDHVNREGNNILHVAATHDSCLSAAVKILNYAGHLLTFKNDVGETPIFLAVQYGQMNMFKYLNHQIEIIAPDPGRRLPFYKKANRYETYTILHEAMYNDHFELALYIARRIPDLICEKDHNNMTALHLLAINPLAFSNLDWKLPDFLIRFLFGTKSSFSMRIPSWENMKRKYRRHYAALQLAYILVLRDTSWIEAVSLSPDAEAASDEYSGRESMKPPTPLILATKYGCLEIALMIIREHPFTVEQVGPEYGSILHLAIKYRRMEIFNATRGSQGNSILHMVALNATQLAQVKKSYIPWDSSELNDATCNPAFELQEDLLLFQRVERTLMTHYHKTPNTDYLQADQLFAANKEPLRVAAQEWMKRTAENCAVNSVLIATIAFTAAYTVPGGTDDQSGSPLLLNHTLFVVFTVSDVLSLASTIIAALLFLSILTSSFRFRDFKESLPKRLMFGISCLVFSLIMLTLAFAATITLMIRSRQRPTRIALYAVAFLPFSVLIATYMLFTVPLRQTVEYTISKVKLIIPMFYVRYGVSKTSTNLDVEV